jgi:hypothetical protein
MMRTNIWLKDGVSTFPIKQPMVGQSEFYLTFKEYLRDLKSAPMTRIFPLIAKWGIGKSRIAFELVSEALGMDKGWIIRNAQGEPEEVRLLRPDIADGILPVYIRYSQMSHDYLYGDNWVAYGAYVALACLAEDEPLNSIQGSIVRHLQEALCPMGFSPRKLAASIETGQNEIAKLLEDPKQLDQLVEQGLKYLASFGIVHLMVIVDEVESETELAREGIADSEEIRKKLDGAAIKKITAAIKHEDSRSRHPDVSYLLLCSPAIGDQIKELEALDRRGEMVEIHQNAYADISDYIQKLQQNGDLPAYPEGLTEAVYTIAGGNFGWMNVAMAYCDQYLAENPQADTGEILEDRVVGITRFRDKLIDISQFQYISIAATDPNQNIIRRALLRQLPYPLSSYDSSVQQILTAVKQVDGTPLFEEFVAVELKKAEIGMFLTQNGYRLGADNEFIQETTGLTFNLDVFLRSLATFSITAGPGKSIVGSNKDAFLQQIRMLYPKDGVEDAALIIYDFIRTKFAAEGLETYLGPNFAFLERLDRRYAMKKGLLNYLLQDEMDQNLKEHLKEIRQNHREEIKRLLTGFARVLELDYPIVDYFTINGVEVVRTKVSQHMYLGVHRDNKVDIIWDNQLNKLKETISHKKIMNIGAHPVIILSLSASTEDELKKVREQMPVAGRSVIFFHLTNFQKEVVEILAVDKDYLDFRDVAHQVAPQFQTRIRSIRDEISKKAKEWFEETDREGYVLRPLIFTKAEEDNLPILAKGFARMLRYDATATELGAKQDVKLGAEQYTRFERTLNHTQVRAKLAKDGYRDAEVFVKEYDGFRVNIPSIFPAILRYLGNSKRFSEEILSNFFFSAVDNIKPSGIVQQWIDFLNNLMVVEVEDEKYVLNVTKYHLQAKLEKVRMWLQDEYDRVVNSFQGIISDSKIAVLHDYKIKLNHKIERATNILQKMSLNGLKLNNKDNIATWKEQLANIETFHEYCDYIYDEGKWNHSSFNERLLEELSLENDNIPIWQRLCQVVRFHEFISSIQEEVAERIARKIQEIKTVSSYQDYLMPISPLINALDRYNTEIKFAKDYTRATTKPAMVRDVDSLAHKLWFAEYKEAIRRLYQILDQVGLQKDTYEWKADSGINGKFNRMKRMFFDLADGLLQNKAEVEHWTDYFQDAPAEVQNCPQIRNVRNIQKTLNYFLSGGFDETIDDQEEALTAKPLEFIELMEKALLEHKGDITALVSGLIELKRIARDERNKSYIQEDIDAVNCIWNAFGKDPIWVDQQKVPDEASFQASKNKAAAYMKEVAFEGNRFFKDRGAARVTFDFFKEVVKKDAQLDWNLYPEEKQELEQMGLIETKVVLKK